MGMSVGSFINQFGGSLTPFTKQELLRLDGKCILSPHKHKNRVNIELLHHNKFPATKNSGLEVIPCEKEIALGHFISHKSLFYYSKRATTNGTVMQDDVTIDTIYNSMHSEQIHDIDRDAKLIDDSNVTFLVDTLLNSISSI